jgi:tyrosyl-DNA phosphodiesterase-1
MKSPWKSDVAPAKRRRLNDATEDEPYGTSVASASLNRPVSPPLSSRQTPGPTALLLQATAATWSFNDVPKQLETPPLSQKTLLSQIADRSVLPPSTDVQTTTDKNDANATIECIASPIQLTRIRDLAPHQNVDTVQLKDILGNPLIRECWNFNFLFDIDFVM